MIKWHKKYIFSTIITIVIAVFIFYLSSIPASRFPSGLGINTKIYHLTIFFLLSFFLSISIVQGKKENRQLIYLTIIISIFYALTDELHQLFVPGRNSSVTDVLIDSIGIMASNIIYSIILNLRNTKPHPTTF